MPVMRTYECPDCEGQFDHLHLRSTEEPPNFCPLCGASTSGAKQQVTAATLSTALGKSGDDVYRAMETSSSARATMAAETLGVDVSEMSAMKITNMNDNMREGDVAAVSTNNEVSRYMATTGTGGLQSNPAVNPQVVEAMRHTRSGAFAGAGNRQRENIVGNHFQKAAQVTRAGNVGTYTVPKP